MAENAELQETGAAAEPAEPAPLITSRFLFVDVSAQRAKQLRRGALSKLERTGPTPHKLERVAMEEVRSGLIHYTLPPTDDLTRGRRAAE